MNNAYSMNKNQHYFKNSTLFDKVSQMNEFSASGVSKLISLIYNRVSTHQNEENKCPEHEHQYCQYVCGKCEKKEKVYCQKCLDQHNHDCHSESIQAESYGSYLNKLRQGYMQTIMALNEKYRKVKEYSINEFKIQFNGSQKTITQINNALVLDMSKKLESIRVSIEQSLKQYQTNVVEKNFIEFINEVENQLNEFNCEQIRYVPSLDNSFSLLAKELEEKLNKQIGQIDQQFPLSYKEAISNLSAQNAQKKIQQKTLNPVIQELKACIENKTAELRQMEQNHQRQLEKKEDLIQNLKQSLRKDQEQIESLKNIMDGKNKDLEKYQKNMKFKIEELEKKCDKMKGFGKGEIKSQMHIKTEEEELEEEKDYYGICAKKRTSKERALSQSKSSEDLMAKISEISIQKQKKGGSKLQKKPIKHHKTLLEKKIKQG